MAWGRMQNYFTIDGVGCNLGVAGTAQLVQTALGRFIWRLDYFPKCWILGDVSLSTLGKEAVEIPEPVDMQTVRQPAGQLIQVSKAISNHLANLRRGKI
jgi:hypothetical protein